MGWLPDVVQSCQRSTRMTCEIQQCKSSACNVSAHQGCARCIVCSLSGKARSASAGIDPAASQPGDRQAGSQLYRQTVVSPVAWVEQIWKWMVARYWARQALATSCKPHYSAGTQIDADLASALSLDACMARWSCWYDQVSNGVSRQGHKLLMIREQTPIVDTHCDHHVVGCR